jgi:large subunit ribosomal protein L24
MNTIKKSDTVIVRSGKDKGKTGKVIRVDFANDVVLIDGINLIKKHNRPKREGEKGEIVHLPRPIRFGKASLYCSHCKKGVRVGFRTEGKTKVRYCKKCQTAL